MKGKTSVANTKKLWIGIGVLALLTPLGLMIPAFFGAGGAWGEWGLDEIEKIAGFLPEGMKHLADTWNSPLPDYAVPGQGRGLASESLGYVLTAIIGVAVTAGAGYLLAKVLSRKDKTE